MDSSFVDRAWIKWVTADHVGSSGSPLKAAVLINYDPTGPSRLLSTIAELEGIDKDQKLVIRLRIAVKDPKLFLAQQEGINLYPIELKQFIDFMRRGNLTTETFVLGSKQYLVTSVHEDWFAARCLNTTQPAGEGVIVMQTAVYVLVSLYDGSIGSASKAMAVADQLASELSRKNF